MATPEAAPARRLLLQFHHRSHLLPTRPPPRADRLMSTRKRRQIKLWRASEYMKPAGRRVIWHVPPFQLRRNRGSLPGGHFQIPAAGAFTAASQRLQEAALVLDAARRQLLGQQHQFGGSFTDAEDMDCNQLSPPTAVWKVRGCTPRGRTPRSCTPRIHLGSQPALAAELVLPLRRTLMHSTLTTPSIALSMLTTSMPTCARRSSDTDLPRATWCARRCRLRLPQTFATLESSRYTFSKLRTAPARPRLPRRPIAGGQTARHQLHHAGHPGGLARRGG